MIVCVTGSRKASTYESAKVWRVLDDIHAVTTVTMLVHGNATGRDTDAADWAESRGVPHTRLKYTADWERFGRSAGPVRNSFMLIDSKPDLLIAFPGGTGTADCTRKAQALGIRCQIES